jgi:hypothetical protein
MICRIIHGLDIVAWADEDCEEFQEPGAAVDVIKGLCKAVN